jgi:hypothetical protein
MLRQLCLGALYKVLHEDVSGDKMKKLATFAIILGLIALAGIFYISAISQDSTPFLKTYGFIIIGYFGLILFAWGWMKIFKRK